MDQLRRKFRGRGRPRIFGQPAYTTTVRITVAQYEWAKVKGYSLSKILEAGIRSLMSKEEQAEPTLEGSKVMGWRKEGKSDAEIAELLNKEAPRA